jgi:nitrobindin-like protein
MTLVRLVVVVLATVLSQPGGLAQTPDPLDRLAFMVGRWDGTAEGQPGKGTARREYARVLKSRFIRAVHWGEYPPQEKNPNGEIHEDEGFFSYDRGRKRIVFRQFHTEGFVNTYVEEPDSLPSQIVFASEAIENIPTGFRARETYLVLGPDQFEEVFEMAEPGKPFEVYSRSRFKRVK